MANCYFAKPDGMQHCYIPFLYVIDFKGALSFDEAQEAQVPLRVFSTHRWDEWESRPPEVEALA